jgi:hypothetical protein
MSAMTFEYEPEAYNFEYEPGEDWPEYDPERRGRPTAGRRPPYQTTVPRPTPRPQQYTTAPTAPGTVTRAELTRALQRVAADIDRLKTGVRANTGQLNDLSDRTGRAFRSVQASQEQQTARFDRGLASARELGVLGAALTGGAGNLGILLLLLIAGDAGGTAPGADGQPSGAGGGLAGSNTNLLLALALSGALSPQTP